MKTKGIMAVLAAGLAAALEHVPPAGNVTLHRLVLVFHGGDCVLADEV